MKNGKPPTFRPPWMPDREQAAAARLAAWSAKRKQAERESGAPRLSPAERGYDRDWFRLRAVVLRERPMCEDHCGQPATVVDHVVSIKQRPDLRLDRTNLRALCRTCHNAKTIRMDGGLGKARKTPAPR